MFEGIGVVGADVRADVVARIHFLARIEDVLGIECVFELFEEIQDGWLEHLREVWRADDAVIVLATEITIVFHRSLEELFGHAHNELWGSLVLEIKKGIEVKVSVTPVAMYCCGHIVLLEESLDIHEELRQVLWWHHHIFEECGWTLVWILEL